MRISQDKIISMVNFMLHVLTSLNLNMKFYYQGWPKGQTDNFIIKISLISS
jgi:hypothetical protein